MAGTHSIVDLAKLADLAEAGQLYRVSDQVTGTALLGVNFVFWAGSSKGLAVRLISVAFISNGTQVINFGPIAADPGLTAGNPPVNLRLGGASAQAFSEAQASAAVTLSGSLMANYVDNSLNVELLSPAGIFLPPNTGVAVYTRVGAIGCTVTWLWAEVPV